MGDVPNCLRASEKRRPLGTRTGSDCVVQRGGDVVERVGQVEDRAVGEPVARCDRQAFELEELVHRGAGVVEQLGEDVRHGDQ